MQMGVGEGWRGGAGQAAARVGPGRGAGSVPGLPQLPQHHPPALAKLTYWCDIRGRIKWHIEEICR